MDYDIGTPFKPSEQKEEKVIVRIVIEGRVQGVGFRNWLKDRAHHLKIDGWVRNKRNESVEALLMGSPKDVKEIIRQSYNGPPFASVKRIKEFPESSLTLQSKGFTILPTV